MSPNGFTYGSRDGRRAEPRALEALLRTARDSGMQKVYFATFPSEVRPDTVDDEMLELVRSMCDNESVAIGVQSGSEAQLERLERGHTVKQSVAAVARIARAGLTPQVDFMFGLPGESEADRAATRQLIEHLTGSYGARVHAHRFLPLPGSALATAQPTPIDEATEIWLGELRGRGLATGAGLEP